MNPTELLSENYVTTCSVLVTLAFVQDISTSSGFVYFACVYFIFFNRKTFAIPIFLPTQKKYSRFRSVRLLKSSLLAMKWNYVNIHIFIFISSFHSFKTLYSTRKYSISFVYLVLQLLLVERTWHGGLSKMTNQKFSSVSKWPTR